MATGPFTGDDMGVACYHSRTGAAELYLNHLLNLAGEHAVVDSTAGAESFASGMLTRRLPHVGFPCCVRPDRAVPGTGPGRSQAQLLFAQFSDAFEHGQPDWFRTTA